MINFGSKNIDYNTLKNVFTGWDMRDLSPSSHLQFLDIKVKNNNI